MVCVSVAGTAGTFPYVDTIRGSGGREFFGQGQRLVGGRRMGVSGDAGEDLKNGNL